MSSEQARRVARRYATKLAANDKVELKVKHPGLKAIGLDHTKRGWSYWYQSANGMKNMPLTHKERGVSKAKLIYTLRNEVQVPTAEKMVKELDEKFDSGHRAPSKKEQIQKLYQEAQAAMKGLDVELPVGWKFRPTVTLLTTEKDASKVQAKFKQLGYKSVRVLDSDEEGYPKEVQGDPEPLIET